jgi:RNA polymerase sigma-70 factor (ECF subfamily)
LRDKELVELVRRAQGGEREAVGRLSELAAERLLPYIHRLTLNYDVAEDILQETLLYLVKSLNDLKEQESFWCWIFRTAHGKVRHYFRDRSREKTIMIDTLKEGWSRCEDSNLTGYDYVIRKELAEIVIRVISKLSINHRTVLALRCYEDMPYSEIAEVMDCKEMAARVLFYRAKSTLRKDLVRRGFGKKYVLLALGLFGAITAKSEAVSATSCVSASVLNVGALAVIISTLGSRAGVIMSSVVAFFAFLLTTHSFYYVLGFALLTIYIMLWLWFANLYRS